MLKEVESISRIQFQDCDPFGHLNNMRYIEYIMEARTDQLRNEYGFDTYRHARQKERSWVVVRTKINYMHPALYNEEVVIQTRLIHFDKFRIVPEGVMMSLDRTKLHAVMWVEFAYFDIKTGRPQRHEDEMTDFLTSIKFEGLPYDPSLFDARVSGIVKEFKEKQKSLSAAL